MQHGDELGPREQSWSLRAKGALEFSATVGVSLFVVLSVLYDEFYGPLGLEPQDVGLTQTVIVQRAIAGVVLIAATGLAVSVVALAFQSFFYMVDLGMAKLFRFFLDRNPESAQAMERLAARDEQFVKRAEALERWSSFLMVGSVFSVMGITPKAPPPWAHRRRWFISAVLLAITALLLTFGLSLSKVRAAANYAMEGGSVSPLTFAGIRVLDIESIPCTVTWLGEIEQRPDALSESDLHCLGNDNGLAVFRTSEETIRVPSPLVAISTR